MNTFTLYLLLAAPGFANAIFAFGVGASLLLFVIAGIHYMGTSSHPGDPDMSEEDRVCYARGIYLFKWALVAAITSTIVTGVVPDKEVFYALAAWEVGSSVEGLPELPSHLVTYLDTLLSNELVELRAETAKIVEQTADTTVERILTE